LIILAVSPYIPETTKSYRAKNTIINSIRINTSNFSIAFSTAKRRQMIPQVVQSLSVGICNLGHELYPHLNSLECKERRQDKNWSSFSLVSLPCTSAAAGQADVLWGAD
jgi:hypothetical protein